MALFRKTHQVTVSVRLPKMVWEPVRKLHDVYGVDREELADAFGIADPDMDAVVHAARLVHSQSQDASLSQLLDG